MADLNMTIYTCAIMHHLVCSQVPGIPEEEILIHISVVNEFKILDKEERCRRRLRKSCEFMLVRLNAQSNVHAALYSKCTSSTIKNWTKKAIELLDSIDELRKELTRLA